ncbi:MAG: PepSY domain-containing protein [Cyanosarcina radialis HA8281-LM2]|jgi:uncharacterized membrane protein YkoI|nr:PepSY domain-containing protein [Cyanosarcina radialis HA8281-LM2]
MITSTKSLIVGTLIGTMVLAGAVSVVRAAQPQAIRATAQASANVPEYGTDRLIARMLRVNHQIIQANDRDRETNDDAEERQESAKLRTLAKITPQQAQQAAEAAKGGRASSVKLENEDGNLVYAVVIGEQEVKVDAGNGRVLYTEALNGDDEKNEASRPRSSIQVAEPSGGDGDGETNDDG